MVFKTVEHYNISEKIEDIMDNLHCAITGLCLYANDEGGLYHEQYYSLLCQLCDLEDELKKDSTNVDNVKKAIYLTNYVEGIVNTLDKIPKLGKIYRQYDIYNTGVC